MKRVSIEDYREAVACNLGWCTSCLEFTTECVEPDAEGYRCDSCGEDLVKGAEYALICEDIVVIDDEDIDD